VDAKAVAPPAKSNGFIQKRFDGTKGRFTIFVTKQAMASRNESAGWTLVTGPPDGILYIYSDVRKNYYPLTQGAKVKRSSSISLMRAIMTSTTSLTWHQAFKTELMGHPVQVWRATNHGEPISKSRDANFNGYEYWEEKDAQLPPQAIALNVAAHGWPNTSGLPFRFVQTFANGRRRMLIETSDITRAYIPPETFVVPKSYKKAKSEFDVANNIGGLDEVMKEWQEVDKRTF
jgi:hypothetical protein